MNPSRIVFIAAVLLIILFASAANFNFGFAQITQIQEQLKTIQLKIIGEKLKLIQEQISKAFQSKPAELAQPKPLPPAPVLNKEELEKSLQTQIKTLEEVIKSLKPRVFDEEAARLEKRILEITQELRTAAGERVRELQAELENVGRDYAKLEAAIRQALEDFIKQQQALVIQEQIKLLQEKIRLLPSEPVKVVLPPTAEPKDGARLKAIQEQIETLRFKIIQEQIKVIQEKIEALKGQ